MNVGRCITLMIRQSRKIRPLREALVSSILLLIATSFVFPQAQQTGDSANCGLRPSQKVDEYGTIGREEEKDRLEKLLLALAAEKDSHAFIVTYGGRFSTKEEAQGRADWAKRYLVDKHVFFGVAEGTNSHINTLTCGYREVPFTEFWITPVGAAPPRCAPTIPTPIRQKSQTRRTHP